MASVGVDCSIILDGTGYWIEPTSYELQQARVARADLNREPAGVNGAGTGAGTRYTDRGPGKHVWRFIIVAFNNMKKYDGTAVATSGQTFRDGLRTSYNKINTTLTFTDPIGTAWSVRFDDLVEQIADIRSQADTSPGAILTNVQYYLHCTLSEA